MAGFDLAKINAVLSRIPEQFNGKEAKVGWFPAQYATGDHPYVAYVAMIQEMGAPEVGIPARPFIRPAIEKHQSEWVQTMADGAKGVLHGMITADAVLTGVGAKAVNDIKTQISLGDVEPLSPVTLVLRKWRREGVPITGKTVGEAAAAYKADPSIIDGVNADPLRDTGLLSASVTNVVGAPE